MLILIWFEKETTIKEMLQIVNMDILQVGLSKCKVNYIKFFNPFNFVILVFVAIDKAVLFWK